MSKPAIEYVPFPKIARFSRDVIVTEKIDGTNACVYIDDTGENVYAASRTRWITPEADNAGFARWVQENRDELLKLGPGSHFGEWWGKGIQCGYGLQEKRFSLFNVSRWSDDATRPACCGAVPTLWKGNFDDCPIKDLLESLRINGSVAAPGFPDPEGIVVFHVASGQLFKKTLKKDEAPKSQVKS